MLLYESLVWLLNYSLVRLHTPVVHHTLVSLLVAKKKMSTTKDKDGNGQNGELQALKRHHSDKVRFLYTVNGTYVCLSGSSS